GKALVPEPYLASVCLAGQALAFGANEAQRTAYLAPMMEGQTSLALAAFEAGARFALDAIETRAERTGEGYTLNGAKAFVLNGHAADAIVVAAAIDGELGLFVVEADDAGLQRTTVRLFDGRRGGELRFEALKLPANRRLDEAPASMVLERALESASAAAVSEAVGVTKAMLAMTLDYLKTREQFDSKIGAFQALQHRAVDMFVESELLASIALEATMLAATAGEERIESIAAAKHQLAKGGLFIARQSIQLHGGIGVTDEADIGLFFKRLHVLNTVGGDGDHHVRSLL
ncbi:MAG: acyl-CoA dehydrogenase, partial [Myxococcota bacterium]